MSSLCSKSTPDPFRNRNEVKMSIHFSTTLTKKTLLVIPFLN